MEIKVNDYVRTDNGIIGKYKVNKNWINVIETNNKDIGIDIEKDIVKHSNNIIDLIECGDYVNGVRILDITGDYIHTDEWDCCKERLNKKIKSIVTHEQYSSLEYII